MVSPISCHRCGFPGFLASARFPALLMPVFDLLHDILLVLTFGTQFPVLARFWPRPILHPQVRLIFPMTLQSPVDPITDSLNVFLSIPVIDSLNVWRVHWVPSGRWRPGQSTEVMAWSLLAGKSSPARNGGLITSSQMMGHLKLIPEVFFKRYLPECICGGFSFDHFNKYLGQYRRLQLIHTLTAFTSRYACFWGRICLLQHKG